jgi:hypothetical protein
LSLGSKLPRPRTVSVCFAAGVRLLGRVIYWLVVLAVSVALLILLVLFLESRDAPDVEAGSPIATQTTGPTAP